MVVGTRSRWVVEVRVIDPSSLRPVAGGRGESEDRCHVCHERVRVACATLRAEMHIVQFPHPEPLVLGRLQVALGRQPG